MYKFLKFIILKVYVKNLKAQENEICKYMQYMKINEDLDFNFYLSFYVLIKFYYNYCIFMYSENIELSLLKTNPYIRWGEKI